VRSSRLRPPRAAPAAACCVAFVVLAARPVSAQADSLPAVDRLPANLAEFQAVALERNPSLEALRAAADAETAGVPIAGTRPDPVVMLGAMNVGLSDLDAGMPASMVPSLQVSQTLPLFGKLGARTSVAEAGRDIAELSVAEAEWWTRAAVAERYHAVRALDARVAVQERTLDLLREFQTVARSLYAAGTGRQSDVLRADVEVARTDASIRRLRAMREGEAAVLWSLLDLPVGAVLPEVPLPTVPAAVPALDELVGIAMESRPELRVRAEEVERARRSVDLAQREVWPDLMVSAQVGRRGGADARTMGGLMVGAAIPIQRGSKQEPRIEMAEADVRRAAAVQAGAHAAVAAELRRLLAELEQAGTLLVLYRDEILPAARANVDSSLGSYRVGEIDFPTLVDAELAVDRYEQEYEQLVADYGVAIERIETAIGRSLEGPRLLPTELRLPISGDDR
jgi:outer membrane protein TolC